MNQCIACRRVKPIIEFKGARNNIVKTCFTCRQSAKCLCGKIRSKCKKCGGGARCECGIIRSLCKEHGGGSLCKCDKIRSKCKEHGGGAYCECGKERPKCKEHGGGRAYCQHDKLRYNCRICKAEQICIHKILKNDCQECPPDLTYKRKPKRARTTSPTTLEVSNNRVKEFIHTKCILQQGMKVSKRELEEEYQKVFPNEDFDNAEMIRYLEILNVKIYMIRKIPTYVGIDLLAPPLIS